MEAMKAQAKGLAREYDRVCDELQEWFLENFSDSRESRPN